MTIALKPERQHSYRPSAYERRPNDFYATPSDLVVSLARGLPQLRLELPRVALDPCDGDGAIRRHLTPFGVDVRLSDLFPKLYPDADGYVTHEPLDASDPHNLRHELGLAAVGCIEGAHRQRPPHPRYRIGRRYRERTSWYERSPKEKGRGDFASRPHVNQPGEGSAAFTTRAAAAYVRRLSGRS
jgi:hypothetical protein